MPQLEVPREDDCRGNFAEVGMRSVPTASDRYVRELDGIRAIAVCFVVFAHYQLTALRSWRIWCNIVLFSQRLSDNYLILLRVSDRLSISTFHASTCVGGSG